MKKYINGEYLDMTEEEVQEMKDKMLEIPEPGETQLDRIESMLANIYAKLGLGDANECI